MSMIRQRLLSLVTRRYPFYSGSGSFANLPVIQKVAGVSDDFAWAWCGQKYQILVPMKDYIGRAIYYAGDLDRKITWICSRLVRAGDTVLDIGANLGVVSLLLAHHVGPAGKVHAFEPNPQMLHLLEQSIARNETTNIMVHPFGLGEQAGELQLAIPSDNAGKASFVFEKDNAKAQSVCVPVKTLTEVLAEQNVSPIRFIKIDVEGYEPQVLRGGELWFSKHRPDAILFELNRFGENVKEHPTLQILRDWDYGFFSIPKCMLRMRLQCFDPDQLNQVSSHDFLAAPKGSVYDEIAHLVQARR